jgi:hypothetical protein
MGVTVVCRLWLELGKSDVMPVTRSRWPTRRPPARGPAGAPAATVTGPPGPGPAGGPLAGAITRRQPPARTPLRVRATVNGDCNCHAPVTTVRAGSLGPAFVTQKYLQRAWPVWPITLF